MTSDTKMQQGGELASAQPAAGAASPRSADAASAVAAGPYEPLADYGEPPDRPHQHHRAADALGPSWSVPWSDLMMVMFVLFASLVTAQAMRERQAPPQEREVPAERGLERQSPARPPSLEPLLRINVLERSREAVRAANLQNVEIALLADQSVKVSVQGPMFFELGKADLRPEVRDFLDRLALVIRQVPYQVQVIGHTDDHPISTDLFPSNWELSVTRATRVARHLIAQGAIDPARFTVLGRSQYQPAVPNLDEEQRARNRRVEIIITRDVLRPAESAP